MAIDAMPVFPTRQDVGEYPFLAFPSATNTVFTSNGEGTLSVVLGDSFKVLQIATIKPTTRTLPAKICPLTA